MRTAEDATAASIAIIFAVSSNLFVLSTYTPAKPENRRPPMMTRAPQSPAIS